MPIFFFVDEPLYPVPFYDTSKRGPLYFFLMHTSPLVLYAVALLGWDRISLVPPSLVRGRTPCNIFWRDFVRLSVLAPDISESSRDSTTRRPLSQVRKCASSKGPPPSADRTIKKKYNKWDKRTTNTLRWG